jgi:hypothetical protein
MNITGLKDSLHKWVKNLTFKTASLFLLGLFFSVVALISALYLGNKAWKDHKDILAVWSFMFLIIFFFSGLLLLTVISAVRVRSEDKERFASYQLVTFFILVLSLLAFAQHHTGGENLNADAILEVPRNVAEMSAIMVLFLLSELAAFIAHDLIKARTALDMLGMTAGAAADDTRTAAKTIKSNLQKLNENAESIKQLQLVISIASLHTDVFHDTVNLVKAWGDRVPAASISNDDQNANSSQNYSISNHCWRILLQEYLKEELYDIAPVKKPKNVKPHRIPRSVRPIKEGWGLTAEDKDINIEPTDESDVSYIATTVGFYASLLAKLVSGLSEAAIKAGNDQKLCMAIVTNMLPAHCWNWPMSDWHWRSYGPIKDYRESMLDAVTNGAEIDRVLLVYDDPSDDVKDPTKLEFYRPYEIKVGEGAFWRKMLLDQMLSKWYRLSSERINAEKKETLKCSHKFAGSYGELGSIALDLFPPPIKCAAEQKDVTGRVYPIIVSDDPHKAFTDRNGDKWQCKKLSEEYYTTLHGENGKCWMLPLDNDLLNTFGGRHDIMFIGLGQVSQEREGLWSNKSYCDWGICLMSSMNPITETMLLTVISGKSVKQNYEWCKKRLNETMNWDDYRLYADDAKRRATGSTTAAPDGPVLIKPEDVVEKAPP